jgi:hypothetical protein
MRPVFLLFSFFSLTMNISCGRLEGKSFSPGIPGYDESERKMIILKKRLREISGIDFISREKLVAINDESGTLFFVDPLTGSYEVVDFGKKGDYEDVVTAGDCFYVLRSDGHIFQVKTSDYKLVGEFENNFGKHVEFESLYYDRTLEQLVLICKECGRNSESIYAYRFDIAEKRFLPEVYFTIPWKEIRRMARNNQIECKPAGAAINPVTNKLFIIASVGKVLLECSRDGVLEHVYAINSYHFQQPEGITFAPDGSMYISNEAVQGKATILLFPYKQ